MSELGADNGLSPLKRAYAVLHGLRARVAELQRTQNEPIAIVGMGCRFPGGVSEPEEFWQLLATGTDAVTEVPRTRWNVDEFYDPVPGTPGRMACRHSALLDRVDHFDADFFGISAREAATMDPQHRLVLEVAWEALENAAIAPHTLTGTATGVYVGVGLFEYTIRFTLDPEMFDAFSVTGGGHSFIGGRLAHFLDLRGPSMSVDTACSSALVALHLACDSLRRRECDLALVGGVNGIFLPHGNISLAPMLSPDGRCKTFDATANGYVRGEGCGVVVLRRLSDAVAAGDCIAATIRGSAVNQDGRTAALTAPNGLAQRAVIRRALAAAGVEPSSIGYVEAHGTGTPLGDPIELEALADVFGAPRPDGDPCVVGSVKTNVGHLEWAAGMAGLFKVVLALQKEYLPPHLHLRTLNPHSSIDGTSLVIDTTGRPWRAGAKRRYAGQSSFAACGTNAHVVFEEAPAATASDAGRPWQLLALSARSPAALEAATERLSAHLAAHPDLALADVAYTLHVGRTHFSHALTLVCRDRADAEGVLARRDPGRLLRGVRRAEHRPVAFMFSGVGDHYRDVARELYDGEPVFRARFDHCAALFASRLGVDLRAVLFAGDADGGATEAPAPRRLVRRGETPDPAAADVLHGTLVAQPALFAIEIALAELLAAWGIKPTAMIGHSIGEWVAACVAGVFSLEDAVALVARRAELIETLPAGAMLAVPLGEDAVRPLLGGALSLCGIHTPSLCVVGGSVDAVAGLERRLGDDGVLSRRLPAARAYHSAMMQPVAARFAEAVATVRRRPPRIPFISNVTGAAITAAEATDPAYWGRHLCSPVRFAQGVQALCAGGRRVLLEVGPGQSLSSFARQVPAGADDERLALPTLRYAYDRQSDRAFLLGTVARLWLAGVDLDWPRLYEGERRQRVALPTYPFERRRYWLEPRKIPMASALATRPDAAGDSFARADLADWFSVPVWRQAPDIASPTSPAATGGTTVVFADASLGGGLAARLRAQGRSVLTVVGGSEFRDDGEALVIRPERRADYDAVVERLRRSDADPLTIVHCWSLERSLDAAQGDAGARVPASLTSLVLLVQALTERPLGASVRLQVVTDGLHDVLGGEVRRPAHAGVHGLCRTIPLEYPALACRSIDLLLEPGDDDAIAALVDRLLPELDLRAAPAAVAYRGRRRWIQDFEPRPVPAEAAMPLKERGVYLITGGLGGLGLAVAAHFAERARARLVLVGRSSLPERHAWDAWLAAHPDDDATSVRLRKLCAIEAAGGSVLVAAGDTTDPTAMREVVRAARERFGHIDGVVHAAGVPGSGLLALQTPADTARVMAPKLAGAALLEALLRDDPPDFLVLFSSILSLTGSVGAADYCAANAALDAWAHAQRYASPTRTVAIDWAGWEWDPFQDDKLAAAPAAQELARTARSQFGIRLHEGAEAVLRALAVDAAQVIVSPFPVDVLATQLRALEEVTRGPGGDGTVHPRPLLSVPYTEPRSETEKRLARIWEETLGIEGVGAHDSFLELGGHSLLAMQVKARIADALGADIAIGDFLSSPTIAALAVLLGDAAVQAAPTRVPVHAALAPDEADRLLADLPTASEEQLDALLADLLP